MKRKRRFVMTVLLIWLASAMTAVAAKHEGSVTTTLSAGGVQIKMNRYKDPQKTQEWEDRENILPGQKIPMATEIENLGEDCLIRFRVTANAQSKREIPLSAFTGISGEFVHKGEYFYMTKPVKHQETAELFTAFTLPETWDQEGDDEIRIHVTVDAVQSRNFTPDFASEQPWGETVIQKVSGKDGDQIRVMVPQKGMCRVVLEGDGIITVPDTFFAEFGTLVPGDTVQGELQIDNWCEQPEDVYWKLETVEAKLLEQAELQIEKKDGTVLYQGNPTEASLGNDALLGTYEQNEKESLLFTIRFPEEMDNVYRLQKTPLTWTFRAVSEDTPVPAARETVRTGESSHFLVYGCMAGAAVLIGILLVHKRRRHD